MILLLATACGGSSSTPPRLSNQPALTDQLACMPAIAHAADQEELATKSSAVGCYYPTGVLDHTPNIQVAENGAIYIARHLGGFIQSTDHGATWQDIVVPDHDDGDGHSFDTSGHGYVHVDKRTGRLYYLTSAGAASCNGLPLAGGVLSWTDDGGETWQGATMACDTFDWGRVVTGPAPQGNAYPSALYYFGVGIRPVSGTRYVDRSLDGGVTWERMANIASATTEAGGAVTANDGTIYFDYPEFIGFDPTRVLNTTYPFKPENQCRQMIAVSEDYGETWRQEAIPDSLACFELYGQQRVAVDESGTVYAVWTDDRDAQLYLVTSKDKGRTWSQRINITPPGATYVYTYNNIVAAETGHILVASVAEISAIMERTTIYAGLATFYSFISESFNADKPAPHFESVMLDPVDDPLIKQREGRGESNALVGMSKAGEGWAVYARGAPGGAPIIGGGDDGELLAARIIRK